MTTWISWKGHLYSILEEMISRGNLTASARKTEIHKLEQILEQHWSQTNVQGVRNANSGVNSERLEALNGHDLSASNEETLNKSALDSVSCTHNRDSTPLALHYEENFYSPAPMTRESEDLMDPYNYTAQQFMVVAAGLDLEGFEWLLDSDEV